MFSPLVYLPQQDNKTKPH